MTIEEARFKLTAGTAKVYGMPEGLKTAGVVVPAVLSDFQGMLKAAKAGNLVSETYNTEDGRAELSLAGVRRADGTLAITRAEVRKK